MKLTGIVAMTPERVIGKDGKLPWHISDDLKFFKKHTTGHPILMGRKTFDSIGKPLPKRENIVLTNDPVWHHDGIETIHHPRDINDHPLIDQQIFVIGGSQIYSLLMPLMTDIVITHIKKCYEGDTYFPEYEDQFPNSELIWEQEDFTIRRHFR
ncbi:dihydrofolate reductase [Akkermansiaceae bacterium]|nr:dihydrofolate reductase [Akkermansiaceae bacterium]MDA7935815.1 dihydrofolate reductase [bacterium]MDB4333085.1 dihydrofolate reductase [Akkermansiaceae bacterium]MDB4554667.1 dihydrofolate reductase [Akkermansiaceae bacterium]